MNIVHSLTAFFPIGFPSEEEFIGLVGIIVASLKKLGQLPGDYHVCPGHDVTSTLERERRSNPFLREAMSH